MAKPKLLKSGLILILLASFFHPSTVFAFDLQIDNVLGEINNIYNTTSQKLSGYKNQINTRINKITKQYSPSKVSANLNSNIGSTLTKAQKTINNSINSVSKITSKIKTQNLSKKITNGLSLNLNLNNLLKKKSTKKSNLIVLNGGKDVEKMLNNFSSKQYTVDANGYVYSKSGVPENLSKSKEYSTIIDGLITGNKTTIIHLDNSTDGSTILGTSFSLLPLLNYVNIRNQYGNSNSHDITLAHELTHIFRAEKGLVAKASVAIGTVVRRRDDEKNKNTNSGILKYFKACSADEEARTVQLENRIRFKNGLELTNYGSSLDDVNKDGKPDGDDSYGKYLNNTTGPTWFEDYLAKKK